MTDILLTVILFFMHLLDLAHSQSYYQNTDCDLEDKCRWRWNTTIPNGFRVLSGEEAELYLRQNTDEDPSKFADADKNYDGVKQVAEQSCDRFI